MSIRASAWSRAGLLLAAVLCAPTAGAREWIVAPDGDDAEGDGSPKRPFRSVSRVLSTSNGVARGGDTITLRAPLGAQPYAECDVRLRVPLTLRSYPGERAHIHCDPKVAESVVVQVDPGASGSRVQRLTLSGSQYYGVFLQTGWYRGDQEHLSGATDVLIEDVWIHGTGRDGIKITPKSDRATIRRCRIWNTGAHYPPETPLEDKNADGIDNVNGSGMVVEDCHIHDVATNGLYFKGGARDVLIQRNRIEYVGMSGILAGFDTSEVYFDPRDNPRYYEALDGVVRNNLIRHTSYAGIGLYAASNVLVANNTLLDTARLGHAAIFFGITFQDWDENAGRPPSVRPRVVNNLIAGVGSACVAIRYSDELGGLSALDGSPGTDHNAWPASCRFLDARPDSPRSRGALAQWQVSHKVDAGSLQGTFELDPEGRPGRESPLIDAGIAIEGLRDDLHRTPRHARPDIGAIEATAEGS